MSAPLRVEHTAKLMETWDTSSYHEIKRGLASEELIVIRPGHPGISQRVRQQNVQSIEDANDVGDSGQLIHP
jgi:hypothetical protein